jgi:hypothetical protein
MALYAVASGVWALLSPQHSGPVIAGPLIGWNFGEGPGDQ